MTLVRNLYFYIEILKKKKNDVTEYEIKMFMLLFKKVEKLYTML